MADPLELYKTFQKAGRATATARRAYERHAHTRDAPAYHLDWKDAKRHEEEIWERLYQLVERSKNWTWNSRGKPVRK